MTGATRRLTIVANAPGGKFSVGGGPRGRPRAAGEAAPCFASRRVLGDAAGLCWNGQSPRLVVPFPMPEVPHDSAVKVDHGTWLSAPDRSEFLATLGPGLHR
jgi:hypothetical protein